MRASQAPQVDNKSGVVSTALSRYQRAEHLPCISSPRPCPFYGIGDPLGSAERLPQLSGVAPIPLRAEKSTRGRLFGFQRASSRLSVRRYAPPCLTTIKTGGGGVSSSSQYLVYDCLTTPISCDILCTQLSILVLSLTLHKCFGKTSRGIVKRKPCARFTSPTSRQ